MKPIAISSYLAFAALSLYAADPQATKGNAPAPAEKLIQKQISPQVLVMGDSPLVRAAKATNRFGKKATSPVITNETLVREGGHFTTTTAQAQTQLPVRTESETNFDKMAADVRNARAEQAAAAEQKKKTEEQKRAAAGLAAARAEGDTPEGLYNDAPALEGAPTIQTIKPVAPQVVSPKPPQ